MRSNRFSTSVLCGVCFLLALVCRAQSITPLKFSGQGLPVVQVSINGSGPYSFLLDTGSNRTLVQKELLTELNIAPGQPGFVHAPTGNAYAQQAVISSVAVAGLAVHNLTVDSMETGRVSSPAGTVAGILGEDFLENFDFLIDNRAHTLTLDAGAELSQSVAGDHLPLSFSGVLSGQETHHRLVLDLKLPFSSKTAHFLVDSGANSITYFPVKPLPSGSGTRESHLLLGVAGNARCQTDSASLTIGRSALPDAALVFCQGIRSNTDVDGLMPTSTFTRLFISHSRAYAIANPRLVKVSPGPLTRVSAGF